ncbi:hypothetical protein BJ912DRAFT_1066235 [Pholiota molesta]|nr:hypothetical protein BJ912DRAFT_1066235 [Pholiota molesta]
MSLLTPPHTSHRSGKDKENKFAELPVAGPSTRSVVWAAENTIHSLGTPLKHVSPTNTLLQLPPAAPARETTPEPSDPLVDLHYLDSPVQQILANGADDEDALGQLIVGYNVLAARLRACVTESTDADASWPIFQPLRKNAQAFADAVVRDVKRALVDPLSRHSKTEEENALKLPIYALPSPASSPLKKKGGLSEEQVKYARDLSTTCLSVIKLLGVVLSIPAVYRVFEEKQLADILTAVLAIPLADELPTPNARKTCAQAIGLLQAIHDLCVYLPAVFIPAFTPLLPSVLANLLAPTLALRTQACHALADLQHRLAYITTASPSPGKASAKSPNKPAEAAIVRTLRTTMTNAEPTHVRGSMPNQGQPHHLHPPRLWSAAREELPARADLRGVAPITWAYFQPPLPIEDGEESEVDEDSYMRSKQARLAHCKVMLSVVECQAGAATIAALLADETAAGEEPLRIAVDILLSMTAKAGQTCQEGVEALHQMTSGAPQAEPFRLSSWCRRGFLANPGLLTAEWRSLAPPSTREEMAQEWVFKGMMMAWRTSLGCLEMEDQAEFPENLLEIWENLLRANVSLLEENGDEDAIASFAACAMKYILHVLEDPKLNLLPNKAAAKPTLAAAAAAAALADPAPGSDDTVPDYNTPRTQACTNGELRMRLVRHMWATCARSSRGRGADAGETLLARLMQGGRAGARRGGEDDAAAAEAQARAVWVGLCVDVVRVCGEPEGCACFGAARRRAVRGAATAVGGLGKGEYGCGVKAFVDAGGRRRADGKAVLCCLACLSRRFSGFSSLLCFADWNGYRDRHTWGLASEDYSLWEELLQYTTGKALDLGIDSTVVLDKVSSFVSSFQTPGASPASGLRLIDLLLSNIDAPEMRELPTSILEHTSETMRAMYPLEPRFRQFGMWMIRSLTTVVEHCPRELALGCCRRWRTGCVWLADARGVWTEHELTYDDTSSCSGKLHDFWNLIYARMAPPAGGWPAPIRHCLGAVGILPTQNELTQDVAVTAPLSPLAPLSSSSHPLPHPISSSFSTPPTAIVRREALSRVQSPQRPQKIFGAFPSCRLHALARQPAACERWRVVGAAHAALRDPALIRRQARRLMSADADADDKENALCAGKIPSVAERIAGLNVAGGRKRRYEEVEEAGEEEMPMPKTLRGKMKPRSKPVAKNPVAKKPRLVTGA